MNNMLTLEEVKNYLEIEQNEIEKYIGQGKLHAYKIGGTYIRFRKDDVLNLRYQIAPANVKKKKPLSIISSVADFWRFNNFYIISLILVSVIAYYLIKR